jgi:NAD-dependent dihydropyrimidine dehydrogenase PreA subunit
MPFTIGPECIDRADQSCVDVCPVDCIYVGSRKLYIHHEECIDCGACETACPHTAVSRVEDLTDDVLKQYAADEERFFAVPLPGRTEPLGSPGGASEVGPLNVDTELVSAYPRRTG